MGTQTYETPHSLSPSLLANRTPESDKPYVLLVDGSDSSRRALKAMLRSSSCRILEASRAAQALGLLSRYSVDLIVLDFALPGMTGPELCRWLKVNPETQLIPVLMLTSLQGVENEINGISSGADEFVARPVHPMAFRARVTALLRQKGITDSLENAESILFTLAQAVEQRDRHTGEHCHRLAVYSVALGKAAGVSAHELLALYRGGYLHDIGKITIPDSVLFKKGVLNGKEWEIMRGHTLKGEEICRPMKSLSPVLPIIRSHHERWDGTGYPDGISGESIPLLARILQVCDIYDALTSVRCYKPAFSHDEAVNLLEEEARSGWRDPDLVALFLDVCRNSLPGIMVPGALEFSGMLSMHHSIVDSALDRAG